MIFRILLIIGLWNTGFGANIVYPWKATTAIVKVGESFTIWYHADSKEKIIPWINEYSPYALVSRNDPSVSLIYTNSPAIGQEHKNPTHTANFGLKLQEKCIAVGVECEFMYGADINASKAATEYLIKKLGK